jgi:hypothetical protein
VGLKTDWAYKIPPFKTKTPPLSLSLSLLSPPSSSTSLIHSVFTARKTMSYIPPHLRNSSSNATITASRAHSVPPTDTNDHPNLSHSSSNFNTSSSTTFASPSRRSSGAFSRTISVPQPVFPNWTPSDRVLRFNPDQVHFFFFFFKFLFLLI